MKNIYLIFSATPYIIGKLIRGITAETYNHVSIALDRDMTVLYSFARRHCNTPLLGGFVKETRARYFSGGKASRIYVVEIPVTQEVYTQIADRLTKMYNNKEHYLYNHLSIFPALFHRCIPVPDAYTCTEFAVSILRQAGFSFYEKRHYTTDKLLKELNNFPAIYLGEMPESDTPDEEFFFKKPFTYSIPATISLFYELLNRWLHKKPAS